MGAGAPPPPPPPRRPFHLPAAGKQSDVAYQEVSEVRTVPRALGAWGDMVVVLRNGDKLELLGIEK